MRLIFPPLCEDHALPFKPGITPNESWFDSWTQVCSTVLMTVNPLRGRVWGWALETYNHSWFWPVPYFPREKWSLLPLTYRDWATLWCPSHHNGLWLSNIKRQNKSLLSQAVSVKYFGHSDKNVTVTLWERLSGTTGTLQAWRCFALLKKLVRHASDHNMLAIDLSKQSLRKA